MFHMEIESHENMCLGKHDIVNDLLNNRLSLSLGWTRVCTSSNKKEDSDGGSKKFFYAPSDFPIRSISCAHFRMRSVVVVAILGAVFFFSSFIWL